MRYRQANKNNRALTTAAIVRSRQISYEDLTDRLLSWIADNTDTSPQDVLKEIVEEEDLELPWTFD